MAFNDVEFCYHVYEMGYYNVICNDVALYHHESLSRGMDDSVEKLKRLHQELNMLYELHPDIYGRDPFYHRYLVKDVLDQEFYAGNRYEYTDRLDTVEPESLRDGLRQSGAMRCCAWGLNLPVICVSGKPAAAAAEIILSRAGAMRFRWTTASIVLTFC